MGESERIVKNDFHMGWFHMGTFILNSNIRNCLRSTVNFPD